MRKNIIITIIITLMLTVGLSGCKSSDPIVGEWQAAGVVFEGDLYSFDDVPELADLYDIEYLSINDDGTFSNISFVFIYEGKWSKMDSKEYKYGYILQNESISNVDGESQETDKTQVAYLWEDDTDLLVVTDPDIADDFALVYAKSGSSVTSAPDYSTESYDNYNSYNSYSSATTGEKNALESALSYLSFTAFSYTGLIDQLEYEGYTYSEAKYAADNCGADWYEQAALCAQQYLDVMSFSRSDLIEQLEFEGFTYDQAVYGVDRVY